jgi:hypothetical protein
MVSSDDDGTLSSSTLNRGFRQKRTHGPNKMMCPGCCLDRLHGVIRATLNEQMHDRAGFRG